MLADAGPSCRTAHVGIGRAHRLSGLVLILCHRCRVITFDGLTDRFAAPPFGLIFPHGAAVFEEPMNVRHGPLATAKAEALHRLAPLLPLVLPLLDELRLAVLIERRHV